MSGPAAANGAVESLPGHAVMACGCIRELCVFESSGQYLFIREQQAVSMYRSVVSFIAVPSGVGRSGPMSCIAQSPHSAEYLYTCKLTVSLRIGWQQLAPARRSSSGTHHATRPAHACAYTVDCVAVPGEQRYTKELFEWTTTACGWCSLCHLPENLLLLNHSQVSLQQPGDPTVELRRHECLPLRLDFIQHLQRTSDRQSA